MYRTRKYPRTSLGIVVSLLPLVAAGAAGVTLHLANERLSAHAGDVLAEEHLNRAAAALTANLADRQSRGAGAASLPPLRALLATLRAHDKIQPLVATLSDAFASEPWWAPVRGEFPVVGLAIAADSLDLVTDPRASELHLTGVITRAASGGGAVDLLAGKDGVWAAVAYPVPTPTRERPPILCLLRELDEPALAAILPDPSDAVAIERADRPLLVAGATALRPAFAASHPAGSMRVARRALGEVVLAIAIDASAAMQAARVGPSPAILLAVGLVLSGLFLGLGVRRRLRRVSESPDSTSDETIPGVGVDVDVSPSWPAAEPKPHAVGFTRTMVAPPPESNLGTLGRYTLMDKLGEGGMAEVFVAVAHGAEGFQRQFVVKRLRAELVSNKAAIAHFIDEAKLGSSLVHSNIIAVFDFGQAGEGYYIAMEYILGRDLDRLLGLGMSSGQGPMPTPMLVYVASETLKALDYAHARCSEDGRPLGLVHRDVSPSNILLSMRGEVKLFDFGIMKAEGRLSQTEHGVLKGNVNFMSPEQARGQTTDARSDLFSLGLVLYFCATGRTLYQGKTPYEGLLAAAAGPTPSDWELFASLPAPLPALLRGALQADPSARFASAASFAAALSGAVQASSQEAAAFVQRLAGEELSAEQSRLVRSPSWSQHPAPGTAHQPGRANGT